MRLTNEEEITTKIVKVEEYDTFRNLIKNKWLMILAVLFSGVLLISDVLAILDKGYVLGIINIVIHGLIIASIWMMILSNKHYQGDKFSIKGLKMFQVAHAIKYVIVFVLLVGLLILLIFSWLGKANEVSKAIAEAAVSAKPALKQEATKVFWTYFGLVVLVIGMTIATLVYYKAVMKQMDGVSKYHEKGTHFEADLKFLGIYLFVIAGILIVYSVLCMTGITDKLFSNITFKYYETTAGGTKLLSAVGRILLSLSWIATGVVMLKGHKVLANTVTYHEEEVEI